MNGSSKAETSKDGTRLSDNQPGDPLMNALCLQIDAYKAGDVDLGDSLKTTKNLLIEAERERHNAKQRLKRTESSG